jgi:hypothetical protein
MKTKFFIPFVIIISFIISSISIAQWTVQGTITGIDTWPSISVYSPSGVVAAGGPSGVPKVFKSTNSGFTSVTGVLTEVAVVMQKYGKLLMEVRTGQL